MNHLKLSEHSVGKENAKKSDFGCEENQQFPFGWNSTEISYPVDKTIPGLFEEQVHRTPHRLALIAEDVHLTYQELNNRANGLANYLIAHHAIQPDQLIAVCLERSEWMLIALLGILKSGGAYVPLDPGFPANRMSFIVNETNAKAILTTQSLAQKLLSLPDIDWDKTTIIVLDSPDSLLKLDKQSVENPITNLISRNLAYVMYTSGTTGTPKGIPIEHKGIVNQLTWMDRTYPLRSTDRVLQRTPYVFDISVWELFLANCFGAKVVFAKPDGHKELDYLIQLIQREDVNIIQLTPTMFNEFIRELDNSKERLVSLRHIFCIGEVLDAETTDKAFRLLPDVKVHNLYGPTEASINVTFHECVKHQPVLIGKPIANTRIYVLDENLQPVTCGVSGELHIAGVGLARGYFNQLNLTKQKFIFNPFQTEQDKQRGGYKQLYKAGDIARWLPDGNLEFLGRNDTQIKLRGYRIELAEIEQVLNQHNEIQQSVAVVVGNRLIAYYVAEYELDADDIQIHAARAV